MNTISIDAFFLKYIHSLTLLCVEDNPNICLLYNEIFEDIVQQIIFAENGEEGYQKYIDNSVDIIITEYDLPLLGGLEMTKKIRDKNHTIPIILVSDIQDTNIIIDALHLRINNFIKKPILQHEILEAVINTTKLLVADKYFHNEKNKKLKELQKKEKYSSYQEDLAFAKELNILRNDFYYQMMHTTSESTSLINFLYQPLDVMSGDAYSARSIDKERTFYLIVDGMGKGISASLTSMLITSFINHTIDQMKKFGTFSLHRLISDSIEYIQPILLEEEVLAVDFILLDYAKQCMLYAKFAMPVILMQNIDNTITRLKSNNPPLSKYRKEFTIAESHTVDVIKFLFYSDGLIESPTQDAQKTYANFIEDDFLNSFTKDDLKDKIFHTISKQEDDITLIFINTLHFKNAEFEEKKFNTSLYDIDIANEWYTKQLKKFTDDSNLIYSAEIVFTELFMNAYEHGNLKIDATLKHKLIEEGMYFDILAEKEKNCSRYISVKINKILNNAATCIVTRITDEGDGFDTQILSQIFRNSKMFNGRGVFISRKNSFGIYYNKKGNSVLYINKL